MIVHSTSTIDSSHYLPSEVLLGDDRKFVSANFTHPRQFPYSYNKLGRLIFERQIAFYCFNPQCNTNTPNIVVCMCSFVPVSDDDQDSGGDANGDGEGRFLPVSGDDAYGT